MNWAPVVYGRTLRADFWWRAVPATLPQEGWLATVIQATLHGGRRLEAGPRFVVSRTWAGTLVGVGCRAADLSAEQNSHERRPLYCFVGWFTPAGSAAPIPPLDVLRERYREWAGAEYAAWIGAVWEEHHSALRRAKFSAFRPAPWEVPAAPPTTPGSATAPEPPAAVEPKSATEPGQAAEPELTVGPGPVAGAGPMLGLGPMSATGPVAGAGSAAEMEGASEAQPAALPPASAVSAAGVVPAREVVEAGPAPGAAAVGAEPVPEMVTAVAGVEAEPVAAPRPVAAPARPSVLLVPPAGYSVEWERTASSPEPATLVAGWAAARDALLSGVTLVGADDVHRAQWVDAPVERRPEPPKPPPPPAPALPPPPLPEPEPEPRGRRAFHPLGLIADGVRSLGELVTGGFPEEPEKRAPNKQRLSDVGHTTNYYETAQPALPPQRPQQHVPPARTGPVPGRSKEVAPEDADYSGYFDDDER